MKQGLKIWSLTVLTSYLSTLLIFPHHAAALMAPTGMPSGVAITNCSTFCPMFGSGSSPASLSTSSTTQPTKDGSKWSAKDDSLCALLGSPTAAGALPPTSTPTPLPTYASAGCDIPITKELFDAMPAGTPSDPSNVCQQAHLMQMHCAYQNSQVMNYCMAYNAIVGSNGTSDANGNNGKNDKGFPGAADFNKTMLALDLTAASACMVACVLPVLPAEIVCDSAGLAAAGFEIGATVSMQNNAVQDYISAATSGLGFLMGGGAIGAGVGQKIAGKSGDEASKGRDIAKRVMGKTVEEGIEEGTKEARAAADKAARGLACATAALFAASAGIRAYNINAITNAAANACTQVNNLMSNNSNIGYNDPNNNNNNNNGGGSGGVGGGTNGNGNGTGGGTSGSINSGNLNSTFSCINNPACGTAMGTGGTGSAASDTGLLGKAGYNPSVIPQLPDLNAVANRALQSGVGAAIGSMLPAEAGEAGQALAALGDMAQKDPSLFKGPIAEAIYSGGGGAGGGAKAASNPLSNLFGLGGGGFPGLGGGGGTSNVQTFGQQIAPMNDIWHANTPLNIFQIVSEKMEKVAPRLSK